MFKALCIIGTGTDVGKTFITSALAKAASDENKKVLIIKPVQTGCAINANGEYTAPDIDTYLQVAPKVEACALELFKPACSPHLAAHMAGRTLLVSTLTQAIHSKIACSEADLVLIETAGGLFTPLNENETFADLLSQLSFPVLLVVGNKLGAVNHTLLNIEACKLRGLSLSGLVVTEPTPAQNLEEKTIRQDNISIIKKLGGINCLASVKYIAGMDANEKKCISAWAKAAQKMRPVLHVLNNQQDQKVELPFIYFAPPSAATHQETEIQRSTTQSVKSVNVWR